MSLILAVLFHTLHILCENVGPHLLPRSSHLQTRTRGTSQIVLMLLTRTQGRDTKVPTHLNHSQVHQIQSDQLEDRLLSAHLAVSYLITKRSFTIYWFWRDCIALQYTYHSRVTSAIVAFSYTSTRPSGNTTSTSVPPPSFSSARICSNPYAPSYSPSSSLIDASNTMPKDNL